MLDSTQVTLTVSFIKLLPGWPKSATLREFYYIPLSFKIRKTSNKFVNRLIKCRINGIQSIRSRLFRLVIEYFKAVNKMVIDPITVASHYTLLFWCHTNGIPGFADVLSPVLRNYVVKIHPPPKKNYYFLPLTSRLHTQSWLY